MNGFEQVMSAVLKLRYAKVSAQEKIGWTGLFGQSLRVDFLCEAEGGEKVVYEVKFQGFSGSAEQKICYAVQQVVQCHKLPTYIVIAGTGWTEGAKDWALSQEPEGMFMGCLDLDTFLSQQKMGM